MRESCRSYSQQICGVRSLEALSQIRISKSLKVCANKLSSSSGKNSCPLNTGIPIESLGIELEHHALIRAEYVGRDGPDQQAPMRYHFVTSWTAATRAELRLSPFRAPDRTGGNLAGERARGHPHSSAAAGVSVRRVEDITDAPWGTTRVSPSTVSTSSMARSKPGGTSRSRASSTRIGLSPIVGLSGLCRAPVFGSTYAGGTIEELGAASLELTLLRRIWRPKHCPLHVPIRY